MDTVEVTYPFVSTTVLEIFIFLVEPEYSSSRLQGNLLSTAGGFFGVRFSLYGRKSLLPDENLEDLPGPADPNPKGVLPKNSAKISSAFLGLNPFELPPLPPPNGDPPLPGGGMSFNPSSPC